MSTPSFSQFNDADLVHELDRRFERDAADETELIACIGEVDERKLYLPAGDSSMFAYCMRRYRRSEDVTYKRITVARKAREIPAILPMLADGRLHLCGVSVMAKYLKLENAAELLAAAAHKTRKEIQCLIAERFPQPDVPTRLEPIPSPASTLPQCDQLAPGRVPELQSAPADSPAPSIKIAPLSKGKFRLQGTIPESLYEKLRYIQALDSHTARSNDLMAVLESCADARITELEKRRFGATARPRAQGSSSDPRYIPLPVRRVVWERDGGQCTFTGQDGHRCGSRKYLQFDHIVPRAHGGEATVENTRLRCRAHNQYEAEQIFGAGFMEMKREAARAAASERRERAEAERAEKRARAETERAAEAERAKIEKDPDRSVVPWLRQMGCRLEDAREASAYCESLPPETTVEDRLRAALRFLSTRRGIARPAKCAA
jgi:5-methylcytosine-specific restriction endonuclease McrA